MPTSVCAELCSRDKDFTSNCPQKEKVFRLGGDEMKRITVVVTDRLYSKMEYLQTYWGMDSWAKVLENLVKIAESLITEDAKQ
jgi:hypothetical protein